jgi:putative GTP pyrophosphokinase
VDPSEWGEAYREKFANFHAFTAKLETLICDLLSGEGIDVVQVESRAKTVDSFVEKLLRKDGKYSNPLNDITDLAGVRVIAYYREDVERIVGLVNREFAIDEADSVQRGVDLPPDRFGYVSDHVIVSVGESRRDLAEWSSFKDLRAEIQVRTATQHAWAAIEHKLGYKARDVPQVLQRRLYRLSALFELADEQFSAVRDATQVLEEEYASTLRGGDLDVPIDSASLDAYIAESGAIKWLANTLERAGAKVLPPTEGDQKRRERDRRDLLEVLDALQIRTLGDLETRLKNKRRVGAVVRRMEKYLLEDEPLSLFIEDHLTQLLLVEVRDKETIDRIYGPRIHDALVKVIDDLQA